MSGTLEKTDDRCLADDTVKGEKRNASVSLQVPAATQLLFTLLTSYITDSLRTDSDLCL